ncbi:MAG: hypothetical protein Q8S12_10995 [Hydrogenophaga sp.]|uniref:hypothetical protein n=1 Tax=Hydrogenophaga sp. TaxID=1904254 RepID=UPI002735C03E|nr:hypothetical protein [Hydrogenophaga sp.]MDP3627117.1 hypothetical protein [Hydrogenophaga sp.]
MMVFDGNETDVITLIVAAVYAFFRLLRGIGDYRQKVSMESFVSDVSYGLTIYPMILLSMVAFSSSALNSLAQSNKVLMSMAGIMSLVVIIRRSFEKRPDEGPLYLR